MEQIIANLLVADNEVIKKATAELHEACKRPEAIGELCQIVVSQGPAQIRQYAAMILKRRLEKLRNWRQVPTEQQETIKQGMLNALVTEREKSVRTAIGMLVGCLIRHEAKKKDGWMDKIMDSIYKSVGSADPAQSELGASTFANLADAAPDQFLPYISNLFTMFNAALATTEQSGNMATPVIYHLILAMTYLVPVILGHNVAETSCQNSIPLLLKSLAAFAAKGEPDEFCQVFEVLEGLADFTPKLLNNNMRLLFEFCLGIANNKEMNNAIRNKAVSYIGWLVRIKKKAIMKQKMLEPTLRVLFDLMSEETEDDDDLLGEDGSNPMNSAPQTLDMLALNLPAEKFIPPLLQMLEPALQGQDPWRKRAAYVSMAIIAEGCSEAICQKYLETMVKIIKVGITAPEAIVRNAAFYALGQFAEHLQPEISNYANEILPILFEFLKQLAIELNSGNTETKHIERMFYALESFCENLEEDVDPHLPVLMERLFNLMNPNYPPRVRELVMCAIGAITYSSKSQMLPYFQQIIEILRPYMLITDNEDVVILRPQAIESLASVARAIGKEHFYPLASDAMALTLSLLDSADDPELRRALYNLIGSLSIVVEGEMSAVLPKIMDRIMESITQTDDMMPDSDSGEEDGVPHLPSLPVDEEIDIEDSDDEDDDGVMGFSVENAYLDEKEGAISLLKELAENTGYAFLPYLEKAYEKVYGLLDHPHPDIRRVSEEALVSFVIALFKGQNLEHATKALIVLIPKINNLVHQDDEISVASAGMEGFMDLLRELKECAFPNEALRETIFSCIHDVLVGKVACQSDDDEDNEEEGAESESVEQLVELAQNILPFFGNAMKPEEFINYFQRVYPIMLQRMQTDKDTDSAQLRCAFYGTIAECLEPLDRFACNYFEELCSLLTKGLQDENEMARQNSAFALGELVLACKTRSYSAYPVILNALSHAFAKETKPAALDNMCGAIARLIINNANMVPLEGVLPVLLRSLPLKEDFNENSSIIKCFRALIHESLVPLQNAIVEQIIAICIHVLFKKEYDDDEVPEMAVELLRDIRNAYSEAFNNVAASNPEALNFLQFNSIV